MRSPLNILFTNNALSISAGTEMSTLDASVGMARRGHRVAVFSTELGELAERLRSRQIPVANHCREVPFVPDVIHGHHEWETTLAAVSFPTTPVISFCRGPYLWQEAPCKAPNVRLWAAVDDPCQQRLLKEGIPAPSVRIVRNGVDLVRFQTRPSLPDKAKRVLLLSNYARPDHIAPVFQEACARAGLQFSAIGAGMGNATECPESELLRHDIVVGKGKVALEALAVGCAVIVADSDGLGEMVSPENVESLRRQSFGVPCMTQQLTVDGVVAALRHYDAARSAAAGQWVRQHCGLETTLDSLEELYAEALQPNRVAENQAVWVAYLQMFLSQLTVDYKLGKLIQTSWMERHGQTAGSADIHTAHQIFAEWGIADLKLAKMETRNSRLREELDRAKRTIEKLRGTKKISLLKRIFRRP